MADLDAFVSDGYAKVDQAAPRSAADAARALLWRQLGLSPDDPTARWATLRCASRPLRSPTIGVAYRCEYASARRVLEVTGQLGDMYVVHPFTAHAADAHRGRTPRFMAQSPVVLTRPLTHASASPLARAFTA